MSLIAHDSIPHYKDVILEKWNTKKLSEESRCAEIRALVKDQQVFCVWWQPPNNDFDTSGREPVIYVPGRILAFEGKRKADGRRVLAVHVKHDFVPGEPKSKGADLVKLEMDECLFIRDHQWESDFLAKFRQSAKDMVPRYLAIKNQYITMLGAMRILALQIQREQDAVGVATASVKPPTAVELGIAQTVNQLVLCNSDVNRTASTLLKRKFEALDDINCDNGHGVTMPSKLSKVNVQKLLQPAHQIPVALQHHAGPSRQQIEYEDKLDGFRSVMEDAVLHMDAVRAQGLAVEKTAKIEIPKTSVLSSQINVLMRQIRGMKGLLDSAEAKLE